MMLLISLQKHKYKGQLSDQLGQDSVFLKMGEYGLISFSDYIFLLTVLSRMLHILIIIIIIISLFITFGDKNHGNITVKN